jgi:hypothetical protein
MIALAASHSHGRGIIIPRRPLLPEYLIRELLVRANDLFAGAMLLGFAGASFMAYPEGKASVDGHLIQSPGLNWEAAFEGLSVCDVSSPCSVDGAGGSRAPAFWRRLILL